MFKLQLKPYHHEFSRWYGYVRQVKIMVLKLTEKDMG